MATVPVLRHARNVDGREVPLHQLQLALPAVDRGVHAPLNLRGDLDGAAAPFSATWHLRPPSRAPYLGDLSKGVEGRVPVPLDVEMGQSVEHLPQRGRARVVGGQHDDISVLAGVTCGAMANIQRQSPLQRRESGLGTLPHLEVFHGRRRSQRDDERQHEAPPSAAPAGGAATSKVRRQTHRTAFLRRFQALNDRSGFAAAGRLISRTRRLTRLVAAGRIDEQRGAESDDEGQRDGGVRRLPWAF
eukprot:scaffold7056_cov245-Pinguiococcus_pyrenoidosus.AAC.1